MNKAKRQQIFERLRAANPHPTTELQYTTAFELLIAVILSAQATDKGVNKATARLFPVASTPEAIHALGEEGLREYIKTIGLFNSKAANIIKTCAMLLDKHGGEIPETREELEALPGVGRKTANLVLGIGFESLLAPLRVLAVLLPHLAGGVLALWLAGDVTADDRDCQRPPLIFGKTLVAHKVTRFQALIRF